MPLAIVCAHLDVLSRFRQVNSSGVLERWRETDASKLENYAKSLDESDSDLFFWVSNLDAPPDGPRSSIPESRGFAR